MMKLLIVGIALVVGVSCQIYTQVGPDGYKYPKPQSRFNLPEVQQEKACPNGGSGQFCCTNGADNADCCDNGGSGAYCCTNGSDNPNCELPTPPPRQQPAPFVPQPETFIPQPAPFVPQPEAPEPAYVEEAPAPFFNDLQTPPPLPSFVPLPLLPKIIPVKPIIASTPAPFQPVAYPADVDARFSQQEKKLNEYLPPLDIRSADDDSDWDSWKTKYGKTYATPEEERYRRSIFIDNSLEINAMNKLFDAGTIEFELAANKYCDLKSDEFLAQHTGLKRDARSTQGRSNMNVFMPSPMLDADVEDEVDWRKKGAVTPVKNQGNCASCWAFSAAGAMESQNFLKTGKLVALSEQNLIDCVKDNDGCDSGYMTNAYEYVRTNPGIDTESSYPYEKINTTCRFDPANVGGQCIAHMEIMEGNEKALMQAVATVGPVAAGIDGSRRSFQFYKSGYYFEPTCDTDVNHAVLIVGYGKTDAGEEYWICKNSWDTDWGEDGYIRMARNKNNHCGITSLASYPLV